VLGPEPGRASRASGKASVRQALAARFRVVAAVTASTGTASGVCSVRIGPGCDVTPLSAIFSVQRRQASTIGTKPCVSSPPP